MQAARGRGLGLFWMATALACTPNPGAPRPTPTPSDAAAILEPASTGAAEATPAPAPVPAPKPPVEVVIRDLDGRPIAGATLRDGSDGDDAARTHLTDARGVAVVPAATSLSIDAPGFVSLNTRAPEQGVADLHLLPASTIAGRVVDPRGAPVVGAEVAIDRRGSAGEGVTTDAEGRFHLAGLAPGRHLLKVRGAGVLADHLVAVGLAEPLELEVSAVKTATVRARAVVAGTSEPCTGGTVSVYVGLEGPSDGCPVCGGDDPTIDAEIAADGSVHLDLVPGLVYGVEVACSGTMVGAEDPIFVGDAGLSGLLWEAPRGQQIRGKVVDDQGRPRPGIELFLHAEGHEDNGERGTVTDEEGRFELLGIGEGDYEVELYSEDRGAAVSYEGEGGFTVEESDLEEVVFVVHGKPVESEEPRPDAEEEDEEDAEDAEVAAPKAESPRISGLVVDARGEPVAGAMILIADGPVEPHLVLEALLRVWDGGAPIRSDARGAFEIPIAARESSRKRKYEEDDDDDDAALTLLAFVPGGPVGLAVVDTRREPSTPVELRVAPTVTFSARVRDRRGQPFPHVGFDLARGRPRWTYLFAPGGQLTIPGLLAGPHRLRLHTPDGDLGGRIDAVAGRPRPPQVFESRGEVESLTIFLNDLAGVDDPVGCKLALRPVVGPRLTAIVDNDGWGVFAHVPAGPAQLQFLPCTVGDRRYLTQTKHLRLRPDHLRIAFMDLISHDVTDTGRRGDLGFTLAPRSAALDPIQQRLQVKSLRPQGPAARAGLKPGDTLTRVDGHRVTGRRSYLYDGLTRVPPGTELTLGLADGRTLKLTAE